MVVDSPDNGAVRSAYSETRGNLKAFDEAIIVTPPRLTRESYDFDEERFESSSRKGARHRDNYEGRDDFQDEVMHARYSQCSSEAEVEEEAHNVGGSNSDDIINDSVDNKADETGEVGEVGIEGVISLVDRISEMMAHKNQVAGLTSEDTVDEEKNYTFLKPNADDASVARKGEGSDLAIHNRGSGYSAPYEEEEREVASYNSIADQSFSRIKRDQSYDDYKESSKSRWPLIQSFDALSFESEAEYTADAGKDFADIITDQLDTIDDQLLQDKLKSLGGIKERSAFDPTLKTLDMSNLSTNEANLDKKQERVDGDAMAVGEAGPPLPQGDFEEQQEFKALVTQEPSQEPMEQGYDQRTYNDNRNRWDLEETIQGIALSEVESNEDQQNQPFSNEMSVQAVSVSNAVEKSGEMVRKQASTVSLSKKESTAKEVESVDPPEMVGNVVIDEFEVEVDSRLKATMNDAKEGGSLEPQDRDGTSSNQAEPNAYRYEGPSLSMQVTSADTELIENLSKKSGVKSRPNLLFRSKSGIGSSSKIASSWARMTRGSSKKRKGGKNKNKKNIRNELDEDERKEQPAAKEAYQSEKVDSLQDTEETVENASKKESEGAEAKPNPEARTRRKKRRDKGMSDMIWWSVEREAIEIIAVKSNGFAEAWKSEVDRDRATTELPSEENPGSDYEQITEEATEEELEVAIEEEHREVAHNEERKQSRRRRKRHYKKSREHRGEQSELNEGGSWESEFAFNMWEDTRYLCTDAPEKNRRPENVGCKDVTGDLKEMAGELMREGPTAVVRWLA